MYHWSVMGRPRSGLGGPRLSQPRKDPLLSDREHRGGARLGQARLRGTRRRGARRTPLEKQLQGGTGNVPVVEKAAPERREQSGAGRAPFLGGGVPDTVVEADGPAARCRLSACRSRLTAPP